MVKFAPKLVFKISLRCKFLKSFNPIPFNPIMPFKIFLKTSKSGE